MVLQTLLYNIRVKHQSMISGVRIREQVQYE